MNDAGSPPAQSPGVVANESDSPKSAEVLEAEGEQSGCFFHVRKWDRLTGGVDLRLILPQPARVLCSNRVSQMTKTYNDIEAVTRLLEEKEKDIELTARIGKELLSNNQKLESTVATLETELKTANEKITQLSHELLKKTELIQILTNDVEDSSPEAGPAFGSINFDMLQNKIGKLEEENIALRNEASLLAAQTDEVEEQEQKIVTDFASQISSLRSELSSVTEEADKYREESRIYKHLTQTLTDKLTISEEKLAKSKERNEELSNLLEITKETQNELAFELADLKEKYSEVLGLLQETQEALKKHKRKSLPTAHGGGIYPSLQTSFHSSNHDSLGTELECSLFSELSLDSGISSDGIPHYKKVLDTVQLASRSSGSNSGSKLSSCNLSSIDGTDHCYQSISSHSAFDNDSMTSSFNKNLRFSSSQRYSWSSNPDDYISSSDSECSDDFSYPGGPREGIPGAPGSADLAEALRRLTPASIYARRAALSSGTFGNQRSVDSECRTPDSIMSTGSYAGGLSSWRLPEKLQIVKPLEGSQTLHHWSRLATPSLTGLLEDRPGIKVRGGIELEDLGLRMYTLTDVEEDEEVIHPGKSFQPSGTVYTYTNSTVLHPDDGTSLTSSIRGSRMSTVSNSCASTAPQTPLRSRRNSTCTFSVTLGLAKLLNERGIKAATPSTLVTPSYTPTATPCNSPEPMSPLSSPDHSRSVSPSVAPLSNAFSFPSYLVSSGAEYLRKTLTGSSESASSSSGLHKSRSRQSRRNETMADSRSSLFSSPGLASVPESSTSLDKKTLTGIRLMETVEKIGVKTLISTTLAQTGTTSSGALFTTGAQHLLDASGDDKILNEQINRLPSSSVRSSNSTAAGGRTRRSDLGTVSSAPVPAAAKEGLAQSSSASHSVTSTLGTLSSMLFGRKGGLL